ncbi:MAG: hypothetical protein WCJ97_02020 [Phycisphaerae bacterium]
MFLAQTTNPNVEIIDGQAYTVTRAPQMNVSGMQTSAQSSQNVSSTTLPAEKKPSLFDHPEVVLSMAGIFLLGVLWMGMRIYITRRNQVVNVATPHLDRRNAAALDVLASDPDAGEARILAEESLPPPSDLLAAVPEEIEKPKDTHK